MSTDYNNSIQITQPSGAGVQTLSIASGSKLSLAAGALVGFNGASPAVAPVLATGASHTVDDVITFLQTLGLCKQS